MKAAACAFAAVVVAGAAALAVAVLLLFTGAAQQAKGALAATKCVTDETPVAVGDISGQLSATQAKNAKVIIGTGLRLKVPSKGLVVAIATAMQESHLQNGASSANPGSLKFAHDIVYPGDHDSVGLFQQRDAWGSMRERMTPASSATLFFTGGHAGQRGLLDIHGWEAMTVTQAAQAVQVSAYPLAYARWEDTARNVVRQATTNGTEVIPALATGQNCTPDGEPEVVPIAAIGTCKGGKITGYANGHIPTSALCQLPFLPNHRLRSDAAAAMTALTAAYKTRFGHNACITDSYRSYAAQVNVFARKPGLAAVPGTSNHGWGTAVDMCDKVEVFGSAQHQWMKKNAPAYGWGHPGWAEPSGDKPEPWHWEYTK